MVEHPDFAFRGHAHRWLRGGEYAPRGEPATGEIEVTRGAFLFSNRFTTSSAMVRRAIAHRFRDGQRHMEDQLLWLSMVLAGLRAARLNAVLSYRYFAPFGGVGLSGNLMAMERAELANYRVLRSQSLISLPIALLLSLYSLIKFARRIAIVALRRLSG